VGSRRAQACASARVAVEAATPEVCTRKTPPPLLGCAREGVAHCQPSSCASARAAVEAATPRVCARKTPPLLLGCTHEGVARRAVEATTAPHRARAAKGTTAEAFDGDALTLGWTRTPTRDPVSGTAASDAAPDGRTR
jgi:hypothetical protein